MSAHCVSLYLLAILIAYPPVVSADTIVIGTNNDLNGFPFGAPTGTTSVYTGEYQQLYLSSGFAGSVIISRIGFASSSSRTLVTDERLNLSLGLSTTTATLATLSNNYAANKGADSQTVFSGTVDYTPLFADTFDLIFNVSPFFYDPSAGNLLLDVFINSVTTSANSQFNNFLFFDATMDAVTERVINYNGHGPPLVLGAGSGASGLVTQFETTAVSIPEPSSFPVLFLTAVSLIIASFRRIVSHARRR